MRLVLAALAKQFPDTVFRWVGLPWDPAPVLEWEEGPTEDEVSRVAIDFERGWMINPYGLVWECEHFLLPDGASLLHRAYGRPSADTAHASEEIHVAERPEGAELVRYSVEAIQVRRRTQ